MGKGWKRLGILSNTQKKSRLLTKLAGEISVATRLGGKDPQSNPRLRLAIDLAKRESCPKETIERAILRGSGELGDEKKLEELFYEGYGPHGIALIVHTQTDNRVRTVAEIRSLFKKYGGRLGETGCVQWLFERCVELLAIFPPSFSSKKNWDSEEEALEVGAHGVEQSKWQKNKWLFWGDVSDMEMLRENLEKKGWVLDNVKLAYRAKEMILLPSGTQTQKVVELLKALEDHADCASVYSNLSYK